MKDFQEDPAPKIINLRGTSDGNSNTNTYPLYPVADDIYNKSKKESNIDPENPLLTKAPNVEGGTNEKNFEDDFSGDELDIPGAELDDAEELIGEEDEENNSYSLGGNMLNDLEEDHGE
jgi:hypothetical protein